MSKQEGMFDNEGVIMHEDPFGPLEIIEEDDFLEAKTPDEDIDEEKKVEETAKEEPNKEEPKKEAKATSKKQAIGGLEAISASWKKSGILSTDFTLKENATADDFKEALYEDVLKPLKEAAELDMESYKQGLLAERGYDEKTLEIAKNLAEGVSPQTAQSEGLIERIDAMEIDGDTDAEFTNRELLIKNMYKAKGLEDDIIEGIIEKAQDDDTDLKKAKEAKKFLTGRIQKNVDEEKLAAKKVQDENKKKVDDFNSSVKSAIESGTILEGANKDTFYRDLYEQNVFTSVTLPDGNKRKVKTSLWNKMQNELGIMISPQNIDSLSGDKLNKFLEFAHTFMYGDTSEKKIRDKVVKETEDELDRYLNARPGAGGDSLSDDVFSGFTEEEIFF